MTTTNLNNSDCVNHSICTGTRCGDRPQRQSSILLSPEEILCLVEIRNSENDASDCFDDDGNYNENENEDENEDQDDIDCDDDDSMITNPPLMEQLDASHTSSTKSQQQPQSRFHRRASGSHSWPTLQPRHQQSPQPQPQPQPHERRRPDRRNSSNYHNNHYNHAGDNQRTTNRMRKNIAAATISGMVDGYIVPVHLHRRTLGWETTTSAGGYHNNYNIKRHVATAKETATVASGPCNSSTDVDFRLHYGFERPASTTASRFEIFQQATGIYF